MRYFAIFVPHDEEQALETISFEANDSEYATFMVTSVTDNSMLLKNGPGYFSKIILCPLGQESWEIGVASYYELYDRTHETLMKLRLEVEEREQYERLKQKFA